jgi:hypothetical protein
MQSIANDTQQMASSSIPALANPEPQFNLGAIHVDFIRAGVALTSILQGVILRTVSRRDGNGLMRNWMRDS